MASVTFLGACGTVTGSATLLSWGTERILVDCGMFQGSEENEARNWGPFPFPARELSAVFLTHAHLDHTGLLPRLVAEGFRGPIYCSTASRGLVSLVLQDAAKLQEEEARYARQKGYSRHRDPRPLFTEEDVRQTRRQLSTLDFDEDHEVLPGIRLRLVRAGHLLGAASLVVTAKGAAGERRSWCFSGDLGRYDAPILEDPESPQTTLAGLLLESTYGDRRHQPGDTRQALRLAIEHTFARGGTVLVPAFALGRTQEVLYHLSAMADAGELDPGVVFLDSPMAIKATDIYRAASSEHDEDMRQLAEQGLGPLAAERFHFCRSVSQSKELNFRREPAVIVAASGMASGGRIVHHLLHRLSDPRHSVVFVGFQAAGTRGRALVDGADVVSIHGSEVPVRAEVSYLPMLSAHADRDELVRWCGGLAQPPGRVFLNHGEDPARKALEAAVAHLPGWPRPSLPMTGVTVPW